MRRKKIMVDMDKPLIAALFINLVLLFCRSWEGCEDEFSGLCWV